MWLICSHVLWLSQSVHNVLFLSACLCNQARRKVSQEMSWNKWMFGRISPDKTGWCMDQELLRSMRKQSLGGQRRFLHVVFLTALKAERERRVSLERQSFLSWPRQIYHIIFCFSFLYHISMSFKSVTNQKHARLLWHVSLGWQRVELPTPNQAFLRDYSSWQTMLSLVNENIRGVCLNVYKGCVYLWVWVQWIQRKVGPGTYLYIYLFIPAVFIQWMRVG